MKAIKGLVSGRVQGVAFRAYVKGAAEHFNISGWVKNLKGGAVEFLAQAENDRALSGFVRACYLGSPLSQVAAIDFDETEPDASIIDFKIIYA